jgi:hypothetical protein
MQKLDSQQIRKIIIDRVQDLKKATGISDRQAEEIIFQDLLHGFVKMHYPNVVQEFFRLLEAALGYPPSQDNPSEIDQKTEENQTVH